VALSEKTKAMGANQKTGISIQTGEKFFTVKATKYQNRLPRDVMESPLLEIVKV